MPNHVSKPCCQPEELSGRSLVSILLELQGQKMLNEKTLGWAANLKCLTVPQQDSRDRRNMALRCIPETDIGLRRNYVAVSYSCDSMSDYEKSDAGGYTVTQHRTHPRPSRTRNIVLERAIKYANYKRSPHLWVDQDCINQENDDEKQLAINSMDLVYSWSKFAVGLMSTVLDSERDISLLYELLEGKLASESGFEATCDSRKIEEVVGLLQLFARDQWWTRAWIFQEEYLAGTNMDILIRHNPELENPKRKLFRDGENDDDFIEGEIHFQATDFRGAATIFLLALGKLRSKHWQQKSKELLEVFGKYNILYDLTRFAHGKAMSFRVIADVHKRCISKHFDKLSIAANSCDYATRFNALEMTKTSYSLNLCTLAMIVLNGEIIANGRENLASPTTMGLDDYLDHVSFNKFDPPVGARELTWLKNCRLPDPELVRSGIRSTGYLWSVQTKVCTYNWKPLSRRYSQRSWKDGLDDRQRSYLFELIKMLRRVKHSAGLRKELSKYLEEDMKSRYSPPLDRKQVVKRYKDVMAREVCRAIQERQPLYLAAIHETNELKAIFVGPCHQNTTIFTAWSYREDEDLRIRTRHLSLSVHTEKKSAMMHLRFQKGVNGLVFFAKSQQEPVIVSWPEAWLRTNPEVIELTDDENT